MVIFGKIGKRVNLKNPRIHSIIIMILCSQMANFSDLSLRYSSESGSWVNLLSLKPNRDCHWNLSSQADSSSNLLAHIWFYPIDCHNLLWFFKWSCDWKLIRNDSFPLEIDEKPSWVTRKISRNDPGNRWKWFITVSRCCITWRSKTYYWAIWCRRWWCCCQDDWSQDFKYWRQMTFKARNWN